MRRILICIKPKLTLKMRNSTKMIVKKCDFNRTIEKIRMLDLCYNSIPIKPANMNRVAVLMNQVKSLP